MTRAWRARGRLRGGMLPGQVSPPVGCVGLRSCIGAGSTTPSPPFGGSRPRRTPALMHEIAKTQSTTSLLDCCYHSLPSHSCPSYWFCLGASAPRLPSGRLEDPQLVGACPPGVSRMCMLNPLGSAKKKRSEMAWSSPRNQPCAVPVRASIPVIETLHDGSIDTGGNRWVRRAHRCRVTHATTASVAVVFGVRRELDEEPVC